jgi:tetratricopeptide (TPR) repeat protein
MILFTLAIAAATPAAKPAQTPKPAATSASIREQRFSHCIALVDADPEKAITAAGDWRIQGGGLDARHCLGLAYAALGRWPSAMTAFEQAAQDAEALRDVRAADFWVQAGNAALAGNDYQRARSSFDAALAKGVLKTRDAGEAHLDRARTLVALRDSKAARVDLDAALKLVPEDPLAWLLSATLARREGDLTRASTDIAEAGKRAPDDASVALEAGNIAILSGADDAARTAWEAAVRTAPETPAGKAAADNLKQLAAKPPTPKS